MTLPFLFLSITVLSQSDYTPRKTYSEQSKELIRELKVQADDEIERIHSSKWLVSKIYAERTKHLIESVKKKVFLEDDSLQSFVDAIVKRLVDSNTIHHVPKRILISKNQEVNAYCYGEGTFIVTVGLLSKISNESQLAFTIAHELAHYELDHIRHRIVQEVENDLVRKTNVELSKLLKDEVSKEELESFRNFIYGLSRYSRAKEMEADSLGFLFFRNANYKQDEALTLLSVLDSAQFPTYSGDVNLFVPFHFNKYPFQEFWLKPRLSIYSKKFAPIFLFSHDSIESHPDIELRKNRLKPLIADVDSGTDHQPLELTRKIITLAEFEAVESAYFTKQYDYCLYLALQLLTVHPRNAFLTTTVSKVLSDLYHAKQNGMFGFYVPPHTSHYKNDLRLVNNFLYNLSLKELGEVAFHFLNNQSYFNETVEEHYYLLWKICGLTQRDEVQKKVKQKYRSQFANGIYYNRIK